VADNSTQGGTDTIRDKDRAGVKTQIYGVDVNIGGASEQLMTASALADGTANPTLPAWAMMGMLFNGTTWDRIRGDTTNGIDVDVTRLPGSPAQEHTTAASPNSARLSDGAAFYNTNTGAQLPSALVSGRLDVNIGASPATVPVSIASIPTVTEKQDQPASGSGTWTSATGANTAVTAAVTGYGTATCAITVPSTITAGVISLEVSADGGTTYMAAGAVRVDNGLAENVISLQLTAGTANNRMYSMSTDAMTHVRARLSTVITGTGNVVVTLVTIAGGIEPLVTSIPPRTMFAATASHTMVVAETLVSLTPVRGFTAGGAATSMTVTANKTLRITSISLGIQNITSAAVDTAVVSLRAKASGTIATTDPKMWGGRLANPSAVLNTVGTVQYTFPDGIDLPSGTAWGISENGASVNGLLDVSVNGYEF